jgi:hypothetical protein
MMKENSLESGHSKHASGPRRNQLRSKTDSRKERKKITPMPEIGTGVDQDSRPLKKKFEENAIRQAQQGGLQRSPALTCLWRYFDLVEV